MFYLAIDIGASSGRHIVGWKENGEIKTEEVFRFANGCKEENGHLIWNVDELVLNVEWGIREAFLKYPKIESLSIDTWGVDYVLLKGDDVLYPCYAYRDPRTENSIPKVHDLIGFSELYSRTGCQFQPFNTIYQLYNDKMNGRLDGVTDFLMLPEYLMYKLCGVKSHEFTNATTTGMVNAVTLEYDEEIIKILSLPSHLFNKLDKPGKILGPLLPEVAERVGGNCRVVLCATHDTGSAVESIPMIEPSPYISSGTWSLLGFKTEKPITTETSKLANYSNEGGVGYNRYQKNIMGLWMVQCLQKELYPNDSFALMAHEAQYSNIEDVVDANSPEFLAPKSMKRAIDEALGKELPMPSDYCKCVYLSLAKSYAESLKELEANLGKTFDTIYIVGGGAKNQYLNTITEEYTKKKVVAFPVEATALGNLKIQMEV